MIIEVQSWNFEVHTRNCRPRCFGLGFVVRTLVILLAFFQALWAFTLIILRFGHPIGVFGIWLVLIGISSVLKVLIGVNWVLFWCFLVFFGVFNFHKFIDCFPSGRDWREYDNRGPILEFQGSFLEFRGPDSEFSSPVFWSAGWVLNWCFGRRIGVNWCFGRRIGVNWCFGRRSVLIGVLPRICRGSESQEKRRMYSGSDPIGSGFDWSI